MTEINLNEKEQIGGFHSIQILTLDEIASCPKIITAQNIDKILLNPIPSSVDITHVAESLSITETTRSTKSGTLYTINGQFEIPYQSSELDAFFHSLRFKEIVMIGKKHFAQDKMYGSPLHPLQLRHEMVNGKKQEEATTTVVKISGSIAQKPVFLVG